MSGPVIKASEHLCDVCFGVSDLGGLHYFNGRQCKGTMTARYTHDDLVRVARECNRLWDEFTAFGEDEIAEANRVVDRLTKGET